MEHIEDEFAAIDNKFYRFDPIWIYANGMVQVNNEDYIASPSGEVKAQWWIRNKLVLCRR